MGSSMNKVMQQGGCRILVCMTNNNEGCMKKHDKGGWESKMLKISMASFMDGLKRNLSWQNIWVTLLYSND